MFKHWLSVPFVLAPFPFLVFMDLILELYHRICFPLYGMPYVKRRAYIKIDRHKLKYLTPGEKIGCMYCGYANGIFAYYTRIAGDTERYWCGIKHKKRPGFIPPKHHKNFLEYGDSKAYKRAKK